MKRFLLPLFLLAVSCNSSTDQTAINNGVEPPKASANIDSGYKVIRTTQLVTANATKKFSIKNREKTEYAIDKKSVNEGPQGFIIKISDKKVLICDTSNNILKELSIVKQWVDKTGPSDVYDLKDKNGVEYSLDHYVNYQKNNYLGFRFEKSLTTYTDE